MGRLICGFLEFASEVRIFMRAHAEVADIGPTGSPILRLHLRALLAVEVGSIMAKDLRCVVEPFVEEEVPEEDPHVLRADVEA